MTGKDEGNNVPRNLNVINPRTGQSDYQITAASAETIQKLAHNLRQAQPEWPKRLPVQFLFFSFELVVNLLVDQFVCHFYQLD